MEWRLAVSLLTNLSVGLAADGCYTLPLVVSAGRLAVMMRCHLVQRLHRGKLRIASRDRHRRLLAPELRSPGLLRGCVPGPAGSRTQQAIREWQRTDAGAPNLG